jgi:hypothetical protein
MNAFEKRKSLYYRIIEKKLIGVARALLYGKVRRMELILVLAL